MEKVSVIIAAAGSGSRMQLRENKVLLSLCGKPVLIYNLELFSSQAWVDQVVVVAREEDVETISELVSAGNLTKVSDVIVGGADRQESVYLGLQALSDKTEWVFIHDGARPLVDEDTLMKAYWGVLEHHAIGVGVPVKDTIKVVNGDLEIRNTPDRSSLWQIQTPQAFSYAVITEAYDRARHEDFSATDDCGLVERLGKPVTLIRGTYSNIKITTREDLAIAEAILMSKRKPSQGGNQQRVGMGYDVHQLVAGTPLVLAGLNIDHSHGLKGHSDADVVVHALMDALLGACALGDIGLHFPDTDPRYKGISSLVLLEHVMTQVWELGHHINNVDLTIVAERPKLSEFFSEMRHSLAPILQVNTDRINIKATTTEQLGFTGRREGIAAYAVVSLS